MMAIQPSKVSGIVFDTNTNKQPVTSHNQTKQTSDKHIITFKDLLEDLMMDQREQM